MSRIRDTSGKKRRNRVAGAAENRYFCKYNEHQYAALMTKAEIVKQIAGQTGLESKMVAGVVEALLERIRAAQIGGENVYFRGFGMQLTARRSTRFFIINFLRILYSSQIF